MFFIFLKRVKIINSDIYIHDQLDVINNHTKFQLSWRRTFSEKSV